MGWLLACLFGVLMMGMEMSEVLDSFTLWQRSVAQFWGEHEHCAQMKSLMMAWQRVTHDHRVAARTDPSCQPVICRARSPPGWVHHSPVLSDVLMLCESYQGVPRRLAYFLSDSLPSAYLSGGGTIYRQVEGQPAQPWMSGVKLFEIGLSSTDVIRSTLDSEEGKGMSSHLVLHLGLSLPQGSGQVCPCCSQTLAYLL